MDILPETTFVNSAETEAERIVYTSAQIIHGFYFKNKFAVLPQLPFLSASVVVLPDLPYSDINDYWNRVTNYNVDTLKLSSDYSLIDSVKEIVRFEKSDVLAKRRDEWSTLFPKIWDYVTTLYREQSSRIDSIEVRITRYGTKVSWGLFSGDNPQTFVCYLREDVPVDYLVEALFTAMVRFGSNNLDETWHDTEAYVDYLLSSTDISQLLPNFKPTLLNHAERFVQYQQRSNKYLASHDLRFADPNICIDGKKIIIDGNDHSAHFSPKERKIVRKLISSSNSIVTYDELFEDLWGSRVDNYSLWALSRLMSRVRHKLSELGFSSKSIQSVYGKGYIYSE